MWKQFNHLKTQFKIKLLFLNEHQIVQGFFLYYSKTVKSAIKLIHYKVYTLKLKTKKTSVMHSKTGRIANVQNTKLSQKSSL